MKRCMYCFETQTRWIWIIVLSDLIWYKNFSNIDKHNFKYLTSNIFNIIILLRFLNFNTNLMVLNIGVNSPQHTCYKYLTFIHWYPAVERVSISNSRPQIYFEHINNHYSSPESYNLTMMSPIFIWFFNHLTSK